MNKQVRRISAVVKKLFATCPTFFLLSLVLFLNSCVEQKITQKQPEANLSQTSAPTNVNQSQSLITVTNLEDASQLAGFQVSLPSFVPSQFGNYPKYAVETAPSGSKRVTISWNTAIPNTYLFLTNDPILSGVGGAETATVAGVQGQRKYTAAKSDRPAILTLYWRKGNMAYVLTGTLNNGIDEATLKKIAKSI